MQERLLCLSNGGKKNDCTRVTVRHKTKSDICNGVRGGLACVAPSQRQRCDAAPLAERRIKLLDGGQLGGAVAAGDGISLAVHDGHGEPSARLLHRRQTLPHVQRGVVRLDALQALGAVVPT